MGNIRQKFFSHLINFFFFFNVFLQFIICRLQFRNRLFQGFWHLIKIMSQHTDFIFSATGVFYIKVQIRHSSGDLCKFRQRFCQTFCQKSDKCSTDHTHTYRHHQIKSIGQCNTFLNAFYRWSYNKIHTVIQRAPDFQKFHVQTGIFVKLNRIIICFLNDLIALRLKIINISE